MTVRLSANLSTLFVERPFAERFQAAADAGFRFVEAQFPHEDLTPDAYARHASAAGVETVLINADAGDRSAGEFGLALGDPGRFAASLDRAVIYAREVGCPRVHVLAGNGAPDFESLRSAYARAAERLSRDGLALMIEPLNRRDRPAYAVTDFDLAAALVDAVPGARLQFDAYHAAMNGHDVLERLAADRARIGHVQVASFPDRGEPVESDWMGDLFAALEGWDGFVGCEYNPRAGTEAGLHWAKAWLER